jgi:hypothetical protein
MNALIITTRAVLGFNQILKRTIGNMLPASALPSVLTHQTIACAELSARLIDDMFNVFSRYYLGAERAIFERDLKNKNWVISFFDTKKGLLRGFTTLDICTTVYCGQPITVVYSGDTIIDKAYRGTFELPRAWIHSVLDICADLPRPIYWLLISSGYKTYRFLPLFYRDFYPRYDCATPEVIQLLTDHLAVQRFGNDYDPQRKVVRFRQGATPLKRGVAELSARHLADPNIAFFAERNPGHVDGDELVCLTEIAPHNFTELGAFMAS